MTDAQYGANFLRGIWRGVERSLVSAVCGAKTRVPVRARGTSSRGRRSPRLPWRPEPSKSAKHPSPAGMEAREEAGERRRERERAARWVTMGALSLEICREHAGWSVHCFNAGFRWKTYRLASPSRKNSADTKLTRRRTTGVDGEYKSRQRVAITVPASLSYSTFAKEVFMCAPADVTLFIIPKYASKE